MTAFVAVAAFGAGVLAPAAGASDDLRARRADLLARIAQQTDRAEQDQAAVVVAEERERRAAGDLATARRKLETRAIDAYIYGFTRAAQDLAHPNIYLEAAFAADRRALAGMRSSRAAASEASDGADAARDESRRDRAQLESERAQLEATIAHQDALDAAVRAAAQARKVALAAQQATAKPVVDTFETDPAARARHQVATVKQRQLMGRIQFGPVSEVPAGLHPTGQVLEGPASWYGPGFDGRPTASGAIYDQEGWTCASKELPLGTILLVSENGRQVLLLVNDRGPYVDGWILDLSHAAAKALGHGGVSPVKAQVLSE
jgi:rare lipoprotein A (peptidoglycan hydrolase)